MSSTKQTLAQYLTRPNPEVGFDPIAAERKGNQYKGRGTTMSWMYPKIRTIRPWEGFSREVLNKCLKGKLGEELSTEHEDLPELPHVSMNVDDEDDLRELIAKHYKEIVGKVLERLSRGTMGQEIRMLNGGRTVMHWDATRRYKPDFGGSKSLANPYPSHRLDNILPGDAKPNVVFKSEAIQEILALETDKEKRAQLLQYKALRQIVHYCTCSLLRYGYIISEKELVIVRVGAALDQKEPEDSAERFYIFWEDPDVEFLSIPASNQGDEDGTLTVCMALWALHLLAANDGYMEFGNYPPLEDHDLQSPELQKSLPRPQEDFYDDYTGRQDQDEEDEEHVQETDSNEQEGDERQNQDEEGEEHVQATNSHEQEGDETERDRDQIDDHDSSDDSDATIVDEAIFSPDTSFCEASSSNVNSNLGKRSSLGGELDTSSHVRKLRRHNLDGSKTRSGKVYNTY